MINDNSVEIQQRAFEYLNIMSNKKVSDEMKRSVLNSMPVSRISQMKFNKQLSDFKYFRIKIRSYYK